MFFLYLMERFEAISSTSESTNKRSRQKQAVTSLQDRKRIKIWQDEDVKINSIKGLSTRTIENFPQFFEGGVNPTNLRKANRWFKSDNAQKLLEEKRITLSRNGHRVSRKSLSGRGRKVEAWSQAISDIVLSKFEQYRAAGIKITKENIRIMALSELEKAGELDKYSSNGKKMEDCIDINWVNRFMMKNNIVLRQQEGKLQVSNVKEVEIHKSVSFFLGALNKCFDNGTFKNELIENVDETNCLINMDEGLTLEKRGEKVIKYMDVVSGKEGITLLVRVIGGVNGCIGAPMLLFKNQDRNYPIRNLPDNIEGVSYRTSPNGWTDRISFPEFFSEKRTFQPDPQGRQKYVFVDNYSGHKMTPDLQKVLNQVNSKIIFFPPNATHLIQPADSFVISNLKDNWRKIWDQHKMQMVLDGKFSESGKIGNPGKKFFLSLAAQVAKKFNEKVNNDSYKAMKICGLNTDDDGKWKKTQLRKELQEIIQNYQSDFNRGYESGFDGFLQ